MSDKQKSIIAMLISALAFSFMGVFVKLTGDVPLVQKVFIRTCTIMVISIFMMRANQVHIREIKHHKLLLTRALFGTMGILLNFYALDNLLLSDANVIFRLSTIFLIILCWVFLGEKISRDQLLTILVAFIGVLFIMKPQFDVRIVPYIIAILGALMAASAYTILRVLGKKEHPLAVVFYFATFTTIVLLPYIFINYEPMSTSQLIYAVLAGASASAGQIGVTYAYKHAPAKEVSIYNYSGVIFSAIFSIFLFRQFPDLLSIIGYFIVFGASWHMYMKK